MFIHSRILFAILVIAVLFAAPAVAQQQVPDSANGWWGPLNSLNTVPGYPYETLDSAKLAVSTEVPSVSGDTTGPTNRSVKFSLWNRGTGGCDFIKVYGPISRPQELTGIRLGIKLTHNPSIAVGLRFIYNGQLYTTGAPVILDNGWNTITISSIESIPDTNIADTILVGFGGYGDSAIVYIDFIEFLGTGGYIFDRMGNTPPPAPSFLTVTPETLVTKDPVSGKLFKPAKRGRGLPANWANLISDVVTLGGFAPGSSESDSAGGAVIGVSYMYRRDPANPLNPKWSAIKDSADIRCWVRLSKWDFKKGAGKSWNYFQKTLENKIYNHWTSDPSNTARGLDSTYYPGSDKRKYLKKQLTKLDPKKTPSKLFGELVALKVNIAASQLGITPAGLGELVYDVDGNPFDEMLVRDISAAADTMTTYWQGYTAEAFDSLYSAVSRINMAFVAPFDTVSFEAELKLNGVLLDTSGFYLKLANPPVPPITLPRNAVLVTGDDGESDWEAEEDEAFDELAEEVPFAAKLYQNYPNPFNPSTTIEFKLSNPALVTLTVYNVLGQEVARLMENEEIEEGGTTTEFIAQNLASGVYFYRIDAIPLDEAETPQHTRLTGKMILVK